MKKVPVSLVTGGAGFIGSHVAKHLTKAKHKVIVLDDLSGGDKENIPTAAIFVGGSITDNKLLAKIFNRYRFDYVFHLAAYAAEGLSHFIRRFNYMNNVVGSENLINLSVKHKVKRFVFTSSIAVYGANQTPFTEETVPHPEDPYGIAKYAVELDLQAAHRLFGLNYTIFRPHNVYGERQNLNDPFRNVIGIFMRQIKRGEPMTIFGDGRQTRAFSYIGDVAPYISGCMNINKTANQIYNIGADTPYRILDLSYMVAATMGVKPDIIHLPSRKEVIDAYSDHRKVRRDFGIKNTVPLNEGLKIVATWAKTVKLKKKAIKFQLELSKNLPVSWKKYF